MATIRTHVVLPDELIKSIDALVGKRGRSAFLTEIAEKEVKKRRLLAFLTSKEQFWKDEDHPELKNGSAAWVRKTRQEDEKIRLKKRAASGQR